MTPAPDARIGRPDGARPTGLWWRGTPLLDGRRTGFVGDPGDGPEEEVRAVLEAAATRLRREGCEVALGPIEGDTWHAYRFATGPWEEPPFLLEPRAGSPAGFLRAGFAPRLGYSSWLLPLEPPAGPADADSPLDHGIRLRTLDAARPEADLRRVHALSSVAFRAAPLYRPIAWAEFRALYEPLLPRLDPDLVLLAERGDRLAGFVFALPDHARAGGSERVVVKSIAVEEAMRGRGLGTHLMRAVERRAAARGYRHAVHALIREGNSSLAFHGGRGRLLRRYVLFARLVSGEIRATRALRPRGRAPAGGDCEPSPRGDGACEVRPSRLPCFRRARVVRTSPDTDRPHESQVSAGPCCANFTGHRPLTPTVRPGGDVRAGGGAPGVRGRGERDPTALIPGLNNGV